MRTRKSRRGNQILAAASGAAASILLGGNAFGAFTMDTNGSGVPWVLIPGVGYQAPTMVSRLAMTKEGSNEYVAAYDTQGSGNNFHMLSPALKKLNTDSGNTQYALTRVYDSGQNLYAGTVPGNVKTGMSVAGISRPTADNTNFSWTSSPDTTVQQTRWQQTDGTYGVAATVAPMAMQYKQTITAANLGNIGQYHNDLEYVTTRVDGGTTYYQMLGNYYSSGAGNTAPLNNAYGLMKMEWSRGTAGTATTAGTLNATAGTTAKYLVGGSGNSKQSLLDDLVPGVADDVMGMGLNPADGNLYFVSVSGRSNDGASGYVVNDNKVYLSAVSFTFGDLTGNSTATYVDLDPLTGNNFQEITYNKYGIGSTLANGTATSHFGSLLTANDLAFSGDGQKLYVSNNSTAALSGDRVFIFNVPEPSGLALLAPGALMALRRKKRS